MPSSHRRHRAILLGIAALGLLAIPAAAGPVAEMEAGPAGLEWTPRVAYERLTLVVSGPEGFSLRQEFAAGEVPALSLFDQAGGLLADGVYKYELRVTPQLTAAERESLAARRDTGLSLEPQVESGSFSIAGGSLVPPDLAEAPAQEGTPAGPRLQHRVVLTNADGVIRNSLCVGFDCPDSPSFSDSTILMMENNTRIKFGDTSNAPFPNNDWEIEANSSSSGGQSYLGFNDCGTASNQGGCATDLVFAVEAGARQSALYVESDGDVGFGTANPAVNLHAVDGNTPALRLEQDGSSGFSPQTWDVAGNETTFFIRDVTSGSQLPFRIQPGADSNSIFIASTNAVGIGTSAPSSSLHVRRTDGTATFFIEEASGATAGRDLMTLTNNGAVRFIMANSNSGDSWTFRNVPVGTGGDTSFFINTVGVVTPQLEVQNNGTVRANGAVVQTSHSKYKRDIRPVDVEEVLAKVRALGVSSWVYRNDAAGARHLSPMAEDFYAAFGLGDDAESLAPSDLAGVALAAVQALNEVVLEKDSVIAELAARLAALEAALGVAAP